MVLNHMFFTTRKSKFNNKVCEYNGHKFDSKKELNRYLELLILERAKEIRDLELQPRFRIEIKGKKICDYYGDFRYYDNVKKRFIVEDVKGMRTEVYRLKKKLVEAILGIKIEEI